MIEIILITSILSGITYGIYKNLNSCFESNLNNQIKESNVKRLKELQKDYTLLYIYNLHQKN